MQFRSTTAPVGEPSCSKEGCRRSGGGHPDRRGAEQIDRRFCDRLNEGRLGRHRQCLHQKNRIKVIASYAASSALMKVVLLNGGCVAASGGVEVIKEDRRAGPE
jgi:hypothetical protein